MKGRGGSFARPLLAPPMKIIITVENPHKMKDRKLQDRKMTDQISGVKNAGPENDVFELEFEGLENARLEIDSPK